ncbi:OmpA family protein [Skermanella rosea]|nr:OmpA family protein [Skermanella rosea]
MFDRPPTVSEVQELLSAPAPRYRSIEIVGAAGKAVQNAAPAPAPAAYSPPVSAPVPEPVVASAQQVVPAVAEAPVPRAEVAAGPPAPSARDVDEKAFGFRINFAFDSAVIPAESFEYIDTVGQVMQDSPELRIKVEGHTDASGSDAYNQALSEKRARAVAEYLAAKHRIPGSRIQAVGMGEGHPLTGNAYDRTNRRVQFARLD